MDNTATLSPFGRALLASALVAFVYSLSGYGRLLAVLVVLTLLLKSGPDGEPLAAGIASQVDDLVKGKR